MLVNYAHDVIGEMLIDEEVISYSRIYPISDTLKYPFSIQQLPKVIRELAIGCDETKGATAGSVFNMTSYDDNNAFHRIIYGITENKDAKDISMEVSTMRKVCTSASSMIQHANSNTSLMPRASRPQSQTANRWRQQRPNLVTWAIG